MKLQLDVTTYKRFGTVYRPTLIIKYSDYICDSINGKFSFFYDVLKSSYEKTSNAFAPCPKSVRFRNIFKLIFEEILILEWNIYE